MKDIGVHLLLFLVVSVAIVLMSAFFSEADDGKALRSLPRRLFWFVVGCGILCGVLLVVEHAFARVGLAVVSRRAPWEDQAPRTGRR